MLMTPFYSVLLSVDSPCSSISAKGLVWDNRDAESFATKCYKLDDQSKCMSMQLHIVSLSGANDAKQ